MGKKWIVHYSILDSRYWLLWYRRCERLLRYSIERLLQPSLVRWRRNADKRWIRHTREFMQTGDLHCIRKLQIIVHEARTRYWAYTKKSGYDYWLPPVEALEILPFLEEHTTKGDKWYFLSVLVKLVKHQVSLGAYE